MFVVDGLRVRGPLAGLAGGLAGSLGDAGYADGAVGWLVRLMARFSAWLETEEVECSSVGWPEVDRFVASCLAAGRRQPASRKGMAPIVGHLTAAGVLRRENFVVSAPAAGSVGAVAELFARHLLRGRGLSPASVAGCVWPVRRFLAGHEDRGVVLWDTVTGASVQAFLTGWAVGRGPGAVALAATALRSLLGFAFLSGWTPTDLSRKVAPPGARRPDPLVAALAAADVERLRDSIPADTRIGARDRAVVVVLSRLGLRAGEAASLSLDDIDWRAGVVAVAGKGAKVRTAPLPPDVGDALVRYLRLREAPPGERRVFLREKAPAGPLTAHGVSGIVADRARKAGLGTVHAHRLRHSAATAVVAAGGTLAEAGQLLGHALPHTTSIYARTDAASLRRLAVEWPEARP